jgi:hypothetical protein
MAKQVKGRPLASSSAGWFPVFFFDWMTLEDGTETSITKYQSMLRKVLKERKSHNTIHLQHKAPKASTNEHKAQPKIINTCIMQWADISFCFYADSAWYSDATFWMWQLNSGYHNRKKVSWSAERLLAFKNTYKQASPCFNILKFGYYSVDLNLFLQYGASSTRIRKA